MIFLSPLGFRVQVAGRWGVGTRVLGSGLRCAVRGVSLSEARSRGRVAGVQCIGSWVVGCGGRWGEGCGLSGQKEKRRELHSRKEC